ncbi:hypothetical protein B0T20DRAFT_397319 [Sordaria brevicollis]|uniref:Uncharacterized protein n=1 Tax=Sordaria brevicollis TaxID=83679 RepID=A0AAE0U2Z3_SORBR|nr:hypothetical protein B0T20DRAFT_397319 [Sordaria brevicollis]
MAQSITEVADPPQTIDCGPNATRQWCLSLGAHTWGVMPQNADPTITKAVFHPYRRAVPGFTTHLPHTQPLIVLGTLSGTTTYSIYANILVVLNTLVLLKY